MKRRSFLKYTGITTGGLFALNSPLTFAQSSDYKLPIPPILAPKNNVIDISVQAGQHAFLPGNYTRTWGYNGSLLGPTIRLTRGSTTEVNINNQLDDETTLHWHGLLVPGNVDGGPQEIIKGKTSRNLSLKIDQPAATCWYHPHLHQKTGAQVANGLAGMLIIDDENSLSSKLPKTWGIDDIPLVLQDKRFNEHNQIDYQLDIMNAAIGWFGNNIFSNGIENPQHIAPKSWLRIRLLNGCNARSLNIAASDGRKMYVIASDGGFLSEPVAVEQLPILPGERFEVMFDLRDGKSFNLVTLPVTQMGMNYAPFDKPVSVLNINPQHDALDTRLPEQFITEFEAIPSDLAKLPQRQLDLMMDPTLDMIGMKELQDKYGKMNMSNMGHDMSNMGHDMSNMGHDMSQGMGHGMSMPDMKHGDIDLYHSNFINGKAFSMTESAFDVKTNQYEVWTISGIGDMMLHPFHVHGTQFRILSENGQAVEKHRQGWKDIVKVEGNESKILVKFDHIATKQYPYMAHCHNLEHEDTGMMLGFTTSQK